MKVEQHDEKQFLDLLQHYKAEDTKKARRNLSTLGFVVIAAWLLQIRLADLKVFGADLSHTSELYVLILCLVLIAYWFVMFFLSYTHDLEIQKERAVQLNKTVSALRSKLETFEGPTGTSGVRPPEYALVKSAVDAYERQEARTAKAARYGGIIKAIELFIPGVLTLSSVVILIVGIIRAVGVQHA